MFAMTHYPTVRSTYAPLPAIPVATIGLGSPDVNIGFRTTWGLLSLVSAILGGYHAHKRYGGEVGWTIGWALGGAVFPIITPIVALIQGYGQPRRGKGFGRTRRPPKRYGRYAKRYRRRKET